MDDPGSRSPKLGPGALVAVVGPSGAGKDTLIAEARNLLAPETRCIFPRRIVTRTVDANLEDHDTMSREAFDAMLASGSFALSWNAHGLKYAIPGCADQSIADGCVVVCNLSRSAIPEAVRKYDRVGAVLVTAPHDVLAERLAQRGRESRAEIAERLQRADYAIPSPPDPVVINNIGTPRQGAQHLVDLVSDLLAGRNERIEAGSL